MRIGLFLAYWPWLSREAEQLADYERAGVDTLLALPFGDRPAIVRALAAAPRGAAA